MYGIEGMTAGVDWLSMSLSADRPTGELWVERGLHCLDEIAKEGYEIKSRTLQGYYGASAGNCFVGSREDGHFVQLTGSHANEHYYSVYRPDAHISRLDVQCTVKYKEQHDGHADTIRQAMETVNSGLPSSRRRNVLYITGSDGGSTTYIGSASSEQQCRIYNKERQSSDFQYRRSWRYEVVYKNDLATRLAITCPYQARERAQWAANVVFTWLSARGLCLLWGRECSAIALPLNRTLPTDVERRMNWLRKQVVPTIKSLVEAGFGDEVSELLSEAMSPNIVRASSEQ